MRNQPLLYTIIALLVIIIIILVHAGKNPNNDESLGQKIGNTIDRATGERK
jgi:hypothetical protein